MSAGLALSFQLCGSQIIAKPLAPISPVEYRERLYELRTAPFDANTAKITSTQVIQSCQIDEVQFTVTDPILKTSHQMTFALYHPVANGRYPAMIVVPTIHGRSIVETSMSYRFCENNIVTALADINDLSAPVVLPDWGLHDRDNRAALLDLRNLIDLLQQYNQVNPQKVGALGLSLGAFTVALLASVDPRIQTVALVAGAGNMPSILTYSAQSIPVRLRNMRMTALNDTSLADYENNLRANIKYDPLYFDQRPDPQKYFMLVNLTDEDVPTVNQQELWEGLGEPGHLDVRLTHVETILSAATIHFDEILKNIVSRLDR